MPALSANNSIMPALMFMRGIEFIIHNLSLFIISP